MSTHGLGDVIATSLFAYGLMAVIALATAGFVAALVAGLAAFGRHAEAKVAAAATSAPAPARTEPAHPLETGLDPAVVAAISAAITAVAGAHRIVYIGETPPASGWIGEVRQIHHGSHHPHHER